MVLQNGIFEKLSLARFNVAIDPKIKRSWNLHKSLSRDLDFFILLSSFNGIMGSMGQSNYAAGNTYQDALAHYRVSQGEKAVALDLGRIKSVGYAAEKGMDSRLDSSYARIYEKQLVAVFNYYCNPEVVSLSLSSSDAQIILGIENPQKVVTHKQPKPWWINRAIFGPLQ